MRRRLIITASVVSLLLCAATAALWARSYQFTDVYFGHTRGWQLSIGSNQGRLYYHAVVGPQDSRSVSGWKHRPASKRYTRVPIKGEPGVRHHGGALGVSWYVTDGGTTSATPLKRISGNQFFQITSFAASREFVVPHWVIAVLFAIPPLLRLAAWRRARRIGETGRPSCAHCRYDLTGNTSGVCPECGKTIRATPGAKT